MANGTYGTKKPANINSNDVEIFYNYRPSRTSETINSSVFKQISSDILNQVNAEDADGMSIGVLPGMYDLRLPLNIFNKIGFYTIYIKPKETITKLLDVSTLSAFPSIRGVVINTNDLDIDTTNGSLVGYRIEYFGENNERLDVHRLITSNNYCEPVAQNFNNTQQKGITYILNNSSRLSFLTLTPSANMSFLTNNDIPFIGNPNQQIALINTKFNPVMLEIEIVEHDIETLTTMVEGEQLRDLDNGIITTFNKDGNIYHQAAYGHLMSQQEGVNYDFKIKTKNITNNEEDLTRLKETVLV